MIQVLEHLEDLGNALREVHELLQPNGIFVVEVPNAGSLRARIADSPLARVLTHPVQRYQAFPIHLYYFEARQLTILLRRYGFRILEVHTMGLGVEELWSQCSQTLAATEGDGGVPGSLDRSGLIRRSAKTVISRFRLGEHLFVVGQKTI